MNQKRRKFLIKKNKKRKDKLRKLNGGAKKATSASGGSVVDDLMHAELIRPYEETVVAHYSGRPAFVYRSVSIPANQKDLLPRKLRKYESVAQAEVEYEMPDVANLKDDERLKVLNHHLGSSVFTKDEGLKAKWSKGYGAKEITSEKNRYKRDMGEAIVRLKIDGIQDGLLQNEDEISPEGHLNFLPAATFILEEHIDLEYGYNGYMPFLDEDITKLTKDEDGE